MCLLHNLSLAKLEHLSTPNTHNPLRCSSRTNERLCNKHLQIKSLNQYKYKKIEIKTLFCQ